MAQQRQASQNFIRPVRVYIFSCSLLYINVKPVAMMRNGEKIKDRRMLRYNAQNIAKERQGSTFPYYYEPIHIEFSCNLYKGSRTYVYLC
jgi:hypothetical protein